MSNIECKGCGEVKQLDDFPTRKDTLTIKKRPYCYDCCRAISKARYNNHKKTSPFLHKATRIKSRSSSIKVPFDLDSEYLESIWTGICPVYGTEINLQAKSGDLNCAELDRFIPKLGYVKGNVEFISRKANNHKNNMTYEEVLKLKEYMEKKIGS